MIDKEKLIDLFTQYEYETLYVKDGEYAVFSSGTSMYPAVEIVKLSELRPDMRYVFVKRIPSKI